MYLCTYELCICPDAGIVTRFLSIIYIYITEPCNVLYRYVLYFLFLIIIMFRILPFYLFRYAVPCFPIPDYLFGVLHSGFVGPCSVCSYSGIPCFITTLTAQYYWMPFCFWEGGFWQGDFCINAHMKKFELNQWSTLNYFVCLVRIHQKLILNASGLASVVPRHVFV